jgi:hypothetical protein
MQVSAFFGRPFDWYARQSRIVKDLILIGVVGLPVYVGALWFEVLHQFFELTSQHQNHAYEWLIVLFVCLGVAAKFFSVRRVIDLRHEVGLRRKAETEGITWPVTMCLPASIAAGSSRIFSDGPAPSAGGRGPARSSWWTSTISSRSTTSMATGSATKFSRWSPSA